MIVPVEFTKYCKKKYKKNRKKYNPKLYVAITEILAKLETDQSLGKTLDGDLKGFRTTRIDPFTYRLIYKVHKRPYPLVTVHLIAHRSVVYEEMARRVRATYRSTYPGTPPGFKKQS